LARGTQRFYKYYVLETTLGDGEPLFHWARGTQKFYTRKVGLVSQFILNPMRRLRHGLAYHLHNNGGGMIDQIS
jgi:hypothetical protein